MSPAQIEDTLATLDKAMKSAKTVPARPAVSTCGCTDPRCTTCRKAAR